MGKKNGVVSVMARLKNGNHRPALEMKRKKIQNRHLLWLQFGYRTGRLEYVRFPSFCLYKIFKKLTRKHERYSYQLGSRKMQDGCGGLPVLLAIPTLAHT